MKQARSLPSQAELNELFRYDPETGHLFRKDDSRADSIRRSGYATVIIRNETYLAHRLIWKMVNGFDPICTIDHKDRNPSNNRLDNLRLASDAQNGWNRGKFRNNKCGFKGVRYEADRDRYIAEITVAGRWRRLGRFYTAEEAHAAYCDAALKHHGAFARLE